LIAVGLLAASTASAQLVAEQVTAATASRLFGGSDTEGGVGDWYLSNGVVEVVVDDARPASDLAGILPPSQVPPLQTGISPTGGTIVDAARVGSDGDQLSQLFSVGGLSTENFILYDAVSAPAPGVVRATGRLLLPPVSVQPDPCITVVTDHAVADDDPFVTLITTATNGCNVVAPFGGFLDAVTWTIRGLVPFSAGPAPGGGGGFDHPVLDFGNLAAALETPTFLAAPGIVGPADGVADPADGTVGGEVAYGLLGVEIEIDQDGPGGAAGLLAPVSSFFGVSSTLVSALGPVPPAGTVAPGGTVRYVRRLYIGAQNDVRSVADLMLAELAARPNGFETGTISGTVAASDEPGVEASVLVRRLGRCGGGAPCASDAECGGGACTDPVPTPATGPALFGPGGFVSHVRTAADGAFAGVVLPAGVYEATVRAPEREPVTVRPIVVAGGDTVVDIPALEARGLLRFSVREQSRKKPLLPAKLVVKGVGGPDPRWNAFIAARLGEEDILAETFGGTERGPDGSARAQGNVVYTTTGEGSVALRPGTYDVYATRGMEYSLDVERVTVAADQTPDVELRLKRVLKTKDAVSADFHVHSGRSFDSSTPLEDRVASFAAEGVEMMVSTEHDKHVDYAPVIDGLGLGGWIASMPGVEVTGSIANPPAFPESIGHLNGWPMPVSADAPRDGAVADEYVAPNWIYSRLRAQAPDGVIQYNHVRAGVAGLTSIGFFNSIGCSRCSTAIDIACTTDGDCPGGGECGCVGYQPGRPLDQPPNDLLLDTGVRGPGTAANPDGFRNLDFDVMEIANGARRVDYPAYRQVRNDWFSLLAQDAWRPGTAVSDSHRATVEHAGWARTFVLGAGDDATAVDVGALNARIRHGAMLMSAGPWIEVTARARGQRAGFGDTLAAEDGKVKLSVRVHAPAWIPVEEVRLWANGALVEVFDAGTRPRVKPAPEQIESRGRTLRFETTLRLRLDADTFLVVQAGVAEPEDPFVLPVSPEPVATVLPDVVPIALTNPIFVDVGGDGFTPPGLRPAGAAAAGSMTGVTRAQRRNAIAEGEYLPFRELRLPGPGA
jgi:hypothetical protein